MFKNSLFIALAILGLSSFAQAAQQYSALETSSQSALCPKDIASVEVTTKPGTFEVASMKITLDSGATLTGSGSSHRDSCQSDIVCQGADSIYPMADKGANRFFPKGSKVDASVEHNRVNDYPAIYSEGFQSLEFLVFDKDIKVVADCYYGLKAR